MSLSREKGPEDITNTNTYSDCYLNRDYTINSVTRLPLWIWKRLITGGDYHLLVDTSRPECLPLLDQQDDEGFFNFNVISRLLVLIGLTVFITYGILKLTTKRPNAAR